MSNGDRLWSLLYGDTVSEEQTVRECDFIEHFMPTETYPGILDLACGAGRHSIELASRGYRLTGADINDRALRVARSRAAKRDVEVHFIEHDLLALDRLEGRFDGIILVWQSFGFFTGPAQVTLFSQMHRLLRAGGRLMLDLHNRLHYTKDSETQATLEALNQLPDPLNETTRIFSTLGHEEDLRLAEHRPLDIFDPHLVSPGEIAGITTNYDLATIAACSNFDPGTPATSDHPRMQLVFERRG